MESLIEIIISIVLASSISILFTIKYTQNKIKNEIGKLQNQGGPNIAGNVISGNRRDGISVK